MRQFGVVLIVGLLLAAPVQAKGGFHFAAVTPERWVASWATAQQIPEDRNMLPADALTGATLRQTVHLSLGGKTLRVHLTNVFGTQPLHIVGAHIARPGLILGSVDPKTDTPLTFAGRSDVTIPAGAEMVSDPVQFDAPALSSVTISLLYGQAPVQQTSHPGSRATSFYASGDFLSAPELANATAVEHWFQIEAIDVAAPPTFGTVAVLGDSITDGHGATTNGNDRWTDVLAHRLQQSDMNWTVGVINKGIGGGRVLLDGLGPNALARFDRDVLGPARVKWLIVLEGINDISVLTRDAPATEEQHATMVREIIAAYQQIVARAHDHGIKVYGATLLPDLGGEYYHPGPLNEADRHALNDWIRARGHFDAVIDFDALTRDPAHPDNMLPAYDSGDHLHPGPAGYKAMGEFVPLSLFK
jgi:lysophospholipase L1-like esterase